MHANIAELDRIFKVSLYGLAMFAGLILGLAENSWLPYVTIVMAVVGYWSTETPGRFALGNSLSNAAGILAVILAAFEFFGNNPEGRLLAGTHLVVYATWIVFLQQSSIRKYWSICALSVLQVAVAAVLTNDSWYGGSLVVFAVASMWTLAVFSLYHAVEQQQQPVLASIPASTNGPFRFDQAVSDAGNGIQFDGYARWITPRFISGIASLALLALVVSAAFYILTPRVWIGQRFSFGDSTEEPELGRRSTTGFTQSVTLGEMGTILESLEPVMTIEAYDARSGNDRSLSALELAQAFGYDEPLFRGGIMTAYDSGTWQADSFNDIPERLQRTPPRADLRQNIALEPVAGEILFCFGTPVACEIGNDRLRASYNRLTGVLRHGRPFSELRGTVSYRLYTDVPPDSPDGIPRIEPRSSVPRSLRIRDHAQERYLNRCRDLPADSLSRLIDLAQSQRQQETDRLGRPPTPVEMAGRLERYLRDSGQYQYTLKLTRVDKSIDPVEDFLFNHKTGHCEYFATALVLMLRAVDIPSRLMNGFKGGDTNFRGQIVVQQRHAHAWVEAWDDDGKWMVLDPTPASARAESVQEVAGQLSFGKRLQAFFTGFWSDWVMNFTPDRQREELYEPLKEFGQKLMAQAEDATLRGPGLSALWEFLTNPREWFSIKGVAFLVGIGGAIYGLRFLARWMGRWWKTARQRDAKLAASRILIPFYERFIDQMRHRGFLRPADRTPAEFAQDVSRLLTDTPATADLERLPSWITELYYRVRYGDQELSTAEVATVNAALEQLAITKK